jgi:acyl transferase domain-containing protein
MSTIFMFSGQGTQYYQMGKELFEQDADFRYQFNKLDNCFREISGQSITIELYQSGKNHLHQLDDPMLSGMSLLLFQLALNNTLNNRGIYADIFLGSSLGTFIAAAANNCIDVEQAISLMLRHGQVFKNHAPAGCMVAVLDEPEVFYSNALLQHYTELAGINFASSFILSLPSSHWSSVEMELRHLGLTFQRLPITRPYHSSWIEPARSWFIDLYDNSFGESVPAIPVVCTSSMQILPTLNAEILWQIIRGPMNFSKTIDQLEKSGPHRYVDLSPSGTPATFLKYCLPENSNSKAEQILTPFTKGIANLEKVANG